MRISTLALAMAAAAGLGLAGPAVQAADKWPSKPVTIVVPFGTGSTTDIVSRLYAKFLTQETGATVVVENRPGGNAMVGSQHVAKAAPDGYTLLMGSGTANAANYALYAGRIPYQPEAFATVSMIFIAPPVIFAAPGIDGESVQKAVASAKKSPKGATCGSGNAVTMVACQKLSQISGGGIVNVQYKGTGQSLLDLAGGQITLAISDMGAADALVRNGRVRPLSVAAQNRLSSIPNVPSAKEQGLDMDFLSWNALFVPAGTPDAIIERLSKVAQQMIDSPEGDAVRASGSGFKIKADREYAKKFVSDEILKWERYVRETGAKGD
ncbi:MAG: Bug family tripartite tricarboxylate transporter substrate binding protein [Burkholderiaceae bacterium]